MSESPELQLQPGDEADMDSVDYVSLRRAIRPQKGIWLRFSESQIKRMREMREFGGEIK
jgi:hypothetical protein